MLTATNHVLGFSGTARVRLTGLVVVLALATLPVAGAARAAALVHSTLAHALQGRATAEELLVAVAAAACVLLCVHLWVLVVMGVRDGVRSSTGHRRPASGSFGSVAGSVAATRMPGRAVSVLVAALVVTMLSGTAAHAAGAAPRPPGAVAAETGAVSGPAAPESAGATHPGSWAALVAPAPSASTTGQGFVPTASPPAPATADLVTAPPSRAAVRPEPVPVVVLAGDSLWSLARTHLGPGATDTEVAAEWPRWWHANRALVGDDPDHLLPGQQLLPPDAASPRSP